jgi:hypothetical protein
MPRPAAAARRTLLALLLGPLLGLVLPELLVRHDQRLWREMADSGIPDVPRTEALLRLHQPGEVDVVVVGDSVAFHSVDETQLEQRLALGPGRVLNLAVRGASAVGTAMVAADALELRPRVLVYVAARLDLARFRPKSLTRYYTPRVAFRLFSFRELFRDREAHLAAAIEWSSVVHRRMRPTLEGRLVGQSERPDETPRRELSPLPPEQMLLSIRHATSELRRHPFADAGPGPRAVRLMATLSYEAGATPVCLQAPLHPGLPGGSNYSRRVEAFLARLASVPGAETTPRLAPPSARLEGATPEPARRFLHVPATQLGAFGEDDFRDAIHLASSGRERLTATLAEVIGPLLEQSRALQ